MSLSCLTMYFAELMSSSVEKCLKMCGLEKYANASVGSLGIEHRKRTTIAVELAAKVGLRPLIVTCFNRRVPCLAKTFVVPRRTYLRS